MKREQIRFLLFTLAVAMGAGCGGGGPVSGLRNDDPGANDVEVVVAFGDSITRGTECECAPYPRRLTPMISKSVLNTGVAASRATDSIDRTQEAIDKYHPGFMLILYGINDVIHGAEIGKITGALADMVAICEDNQVVPVLATYPEPILNYVSFAPRALQLNEAIRDLAGELGVACVDLEREFAANPEFYEEEDGLHPNDAGTQIIALAFADLF